METFTEENIGQLVLSEYGCHVTTIKQLPGYCDLNYHIFLADEHKNEHMTKVSADGYVLKIFISDISQRMDIIKAWQDLIQHLASHDIPVPRVTPTVHGELVNNIQVTCGTERPAAMTMYQYIPGERVDEVNVSSVENVLIQVGELAGRTNMAMQTFVSPTLSSYELIWKIDAVEEIASLVDKYSIGDDHLLLDVIQMYRDKILPVIHKLQKGIIHGDLGPQNILMRHSSDNGAEEYMVSGLIDFEHSSESCYVFEIAITVAHMLKMFHDHEQFSVVFVCRHILQAYMKHVALSDEERKIFQLCVCIRLLQLYVLGTEALETDPSNDYLRSHAEGNLETIKQVMDINEDSFVQSVFFT